MQSQPPLPPSAIFLRFLRFGLLAWGGPVAQIAMLRRELVDEEGWVSDGRFLRLLAVYQILPGPEAHELSVHLGMVRGGRLGGILAGLGFMLPGFVLMLGLSWLYFQIDLSQASIAAVLLGVQICVIALIARACHQIGRRALTNPTLFAIAVGAAATTLAGVTFWLTLPIAAVAYPLLRGLPRWWSMAAVALTLFALALVIVGPAFTVPGGSNLIATRVSVEPSLLVLFASGLKAGLLTFGGAYTVIPFIRDDAVGSGWMTDSRFLDGLALSGVLPAPLIIFSTFVGYVAGGLPGALAMTIGIFLPAFAFSLVIGDRLNAVVENEELHTLLEGVVAAVVGIIVATALELGATLLRQVPSLLPAVAIFVGALALLYFWRAKTNVVFAMVGSGVAGWLILR